MELSPAEQHEYKAGGRGAPKIGSVHELFHNPGKWNVWSAGPEVGTWWLLPLSESWDLDHADSELDPKYIVARSGSAIAVKTKELK